MTPYGKRLGEAMAKRDMSVKELSKISGISTAAIYDALEHDVYPSTFTLSCLADVFGVSMDWLFGRSDK